MNSNDTGLVIEAYGAGNIPATRHDIVEEISKAVQRGVIIVNITQCTTGAVAPLYATGQVSYLFFTFYDEKQMPVFESSLF